MCLPKLPTLPVWLPCVTVVACNQRLSTWDGGTDRRAAPVRGQASTQKFDALVREVEATRMLEVDAVTHSALIVKFKQSTGLDVFAFLQVRSHRLLAA